MATPFFIVGCGRSGTTLLASLLDAHSNIAVPPESQLYYRLGHYSDSYGDFAVERNRRQFIRDLLADSYIRMWGLGTTIEEIESTATGLTRAGIIDALFRIYAQRMGAQRWGDKTTEHIRYLDLIKSDFPTAKLIHLVRDGRDTAEAYRRMIYGPVSPLGLGRLWRDEVMRWQGHHGLVVRYEDLVANTQDVLKRTFDFIGEPYEDTTRTYRDSDLSRSSFASHTWHSSLRAKISTEKIGIYRRRFTDRDIEIIEAVAGDALRAYGYALDHQHPRGPNAWDGLYAFVADPVVRWWRKLRQPVVFWWDFQFRLRTLRRKLGRSRGGTN